MRIAFAADHAGSALKDELLRRSRRGRRRPRAHRPRRRRQRPDRRLPGLRPATRRSDAERRGRPRRAGLRQRRRRLDRGLQAARRPGGRLSRHLLGPPGRRARRHERALPRRRVIGPETAHECVPRLPRRHLQQRAAPCRAGSARSSRSRPTRPGRGATSDPEASQTTGATGMTITHGGRDATRLAVATATRSGHPRAVGGPAVRPRHVALDDGPDGGEPRSTTGSAGSTRRPGSRPDPGPRGVRGADPGAGFRAVVVAGMGGSSLAPDVLVRVFGTTDDWLELRVLDSTDPAAVAATVDDLDPLSTLFIVSSKSGTTTETAAFQADAWARTRGALEARGSDESPGMLMVAITDPGRSLYAIAHHDDLREVFLNPPDIGGRYSALTYVGLIPASLIGIDLDPLLESAGSMLGALPDRRCRSEPRPGPGRRPGDARSCSAATSSPWWPIRRSRRSAPGSSSSSPRAPASTGAGSCRSTSSRSAAAPSTDPTASSSGSPGRRRALRAGSGRDLRRRPHGGPGGGGHPVIRIALEDPMDLGGEFVRWEVATAMAGAVLGIDPFDQPDVESAKEATRRLLENHGRGADLPEPLATTADGLSLYAGPGLASVGGDAARILAAHLARLPASGYLAVQAFVAPGPARDAAIEQVRRAVRDRTGRATTAGYGPRFLHSTGQLHKGGPPNRLLPPADRRSPRRPRDPGLAAHLRPAHRRPGCGRPSGAGGAASADPPDPSRARHRRRLRGTRAADRSGARSTRARRLGHRPPTGGATMRIGFIGLGRMGANMVRRLLRDGHEVVAYNRSPEKTREIATEGAEPAFDMAELVGSLADASAPSGSWSRRRAPTEAQIDELHRASRAGRHDHRRRQHELPRRRPAARQARRARHPLRGRRCLGRRLGPPGRLLPDGRRRPGRGRAAGAGLPQPGPPGRLSPRWWARGGPLREDGPQRHRVRPDAGLRRGLRDHARQRLRPRPGGGRRPLEPRLGRPIVAAGARRAGVPGRWPGPGGAQGLGRRLGRGPLDGPGGDGPRRAQRRSSRSRSRPASGPARTTRTGRRCWPPCATSSADTRSRRTDE